jgi:hypothetical protein
MVEMMKGIQSFGFGFNEADYIVLKVLLAKTPKVNALFGESVQGERSHKSYGGWIF